MPVTIVATLGDAAANSYVTEAEAITYAATRLNLSGWATVTGSTATEDEKKALIEATREIDAQLSFKGRRYTSTQHLAWPRAYALMAEDEPLDVLLLNSGLDLYYTGVPKRLKDATVELAIEFLKAGTVDVAAAPDTRVMVRRKVDVIETQWAPGTGTSPLVGLARFPRVAALLSPLLVESANEVVRQ